MARQRRPATDLVAHVGAASLGLFITAGLYKPLVPFFDVTLATAAVTACAVFAILLRSQFRVRASGLLLVVAMFLAFGIAAFWSGRTPYANQKVLALFSLTALAAVAPFFVMQGVRQFQVFLAAMCTAGMLSTAAIAFQPESFLSPERLTIAGGNPIGTARLLLLTSLLVLLGAIATRTHIALAVAVAVPLSVLAVATGSRGPIAAFLFALVAGLAAILAHAVLSRRQRRRFLAVAAAVVVAVALLVVPWSLRSTPDYALDRLSGSLSFEADTSSVARLAAIDLALKDASAHPLGTGWGTFELPSQTDFVYPHNLFAEVFAEGGWLSGMLLIALIGLAFVRVITSSERFPVWVSATWIGTIVYLLMNAMVTGDINGNRGLLTLASIGLALAVPLRSRRQTPPDQRSTSATPIVGPSR